MTSMACARRNLISPNPWNNNTHCAENEDAGTHSHFPKFLSFRCESLLLTYFGKLRKVVLCITNNKKRIHLTLTKICIFSNSLSKFK